MATRTVNQNMSGAALAISATLPATYDAAGYGNTAIVYTAAGQIESFGNHGVTKQVTEFTPVADAVVQSYSGSKNYGTKSLMVGYIPGDAGQVILRAASESSNRYSVKITYPLGTGESTAEIHYLDVLVTKLENQDGAVNDIRKLAVDLKICRTFVIVPAT
jgi:hypothetical protein